MNWFRKSSDIFSDPFDSLRVGPEHGRRADLPCSDEGCGGMSHIIQPAAVKIGVESVEKEEILEELVDLLVRAEEVRDRDGVLGALRKREALGSTGIGQGVAVPHAKHESMERLVGALGISRDGIEFESLDGQPAKIVFLLLARADHPGPHLRALAEVARLVHTDGFVDRLIQAPDAVSALRTIRAEE